MTSGVGGGDMLPLAQIEQAIKDAIHALKRPYIATIATYAGDFDFDHDRDFAQVVSRFPAVWTTFDGSGNPEKLGANKTKIPLKFSVIVGARSIRSEESSRHGTTVSGALVDVGTFQLINDVMEAIQGNNFGICNIKPFEIGQLRTIFNTKTQNEAVSVLSLSITTDCTISIRKEEDNTAEYIEKVNIDYISADRVIAGDLVEVQHG